MFNVPAFVATIAEESDISTAYIKAKLELVAEDEKGKDRTASRIMSFLHGNDERIGINVIRLLGHAFGNGDEMAFLEKIELKNIVEQASVEKKKFQLDQIKTVYGLLYEVLYDCDESFGYNFIPGTQEDGFVYYEKKVDTVRMYVCKTFLDNREIRERLLRIIDETEHFIKSYSVPGVVKRWKEVNPNICFFDVVYDVFNEDYDIYMKICKKEVWIDDETPLMFDFEPTKKDFIEREKYFQGIAKKLRDSNLQYSREKIFRNELLKTLELVFEHDFPEMK